MQFVNTTVSPIFSQCAYTLTFAHMSLLYLTMLRSIYIERKSWHTLYPTPCLGSLFHVDIRISRRAMSAKLLNVWMIPDFTKENRVPHESGIQSETDVREFAKTERNRFKRSSCKLFPRIYCGGRRGTRYKIEGFSKFSACRIFPGITVKDRIFIKAQIVLRFWIFTSYHRSLISSALLLVISRL